MAYEKAIQFFVLVANHRRIAVRSLAEQLGCSHKHVYDLVRTARQYMPLRLELGVVINDRLGDKLGAGAAEEADHA